MLVKVIKYLYIFKGVDHSTISMLTESCVRLYVGTVNQADEILFYENCQYIVASEVC